METAYPPGGGYDSFTGPTLHLRPDELDRLDASQIDPMEGASGLEPYRRMENSIQGTLAAFSSNNRIQQQQQQPYSMGYNHMPPQVSSSVGGNALTSPVIAPRSQPIMNFTPPSSQPYNHGEKEAAPIFGTRFEYATGGVDRSAPPNSQLESVPCESTGSGEKNYRENLRKLQADLDEMVTHHKRVVSHWEQMERGMQNEIVATKRDIQKEKDLRDADKERYGKVIRELKARIRELEDQLEAQKSRRLTRSVSFALSDEEESDEGDFDDNFDQRWAGTHRPLKPSTMGRHEYERRVVQLKKEHDSKVANLVKHFEKEKASALEILKSKIRAEVSLLIPQIKERYQRVYSEKIESLRESVANQIKSQYEEKLGRMREDHSVERRVWQRQAREQIERERREITKKLKAKYEMRLMDIENECERRILARVREANRSGRRRDGYLEGEDSFVV